MHLLSSLALAASATAAVIPRGSPKPYYEDGAQGDSLEGYLFAYFTNNTLAGENIFFAASKGNNALDWEELNGGNPVITSTKGTKGLRDPFLIRSQEGDTFWLIATDLSIGSGTSWDSAVRNGSRYLEIWESNDLENWSEQRHIEVSPPTAGNTWAPEAYYDTEIEAYVVFWASSLYDEDDTAHAGESYHRMMYATTQDFITLSEPKIWQDSGDSRIDTTVIHEGDTYYRFTKDEGSVTGCTDIIQESSTSLLAPVDGWTTIASCIGRDAGAQAVEGPTSFKSNRNDSNGEKYYLFVDEYSGRGYIPLETDDIANPNWTLSSSYNLPSSPRHGTVLPIFAEELATVTSTKEKRCEHSLLSKRSTLIPGLYADPNIAVFGCKFYIYATTDGVPNWGGNTFYVWSSDNLVDWSRSEEPVLTLNGTSGNVPWAVGNAWAPTIAEKDGKYYFYFSGDNPTYERKTIGVAVADHPEGPFTAEPLPFILNNEAINTSQAIDADAFHDPVSGKYYLYWGNGEKSSDALVAELTDDMLELKPNTTRQLAGLVDFREALFMNFRQGVYHLTYSVDDTRSEDYRVGYATSDNPLGPFEYRGIILQKDVEQGLLATAHNSIINVPGTDDWFIAYHRFSIPNGNGTMRETTIDELHFDNETGLILPVVPTLDGITEPVEIRE